LSEPPPGGIVPSAPPPPLDVPELAPSTRPPRLAAVPGLSLDEPFAEDDAPPRASEQRLVAGPPKPPPPKPPPPKPPGPGSADRGLEPPVEMLDLDADPEAPSGLDLQVAPHRRSALSATPPELDPAPPPRTRGPSPAG